MFPHRYLFVECVLSTYYVQNTVVTSEHFFKKREKKGFWTRTNNIHIFQSHQSKKLPFKRTSGYYRRAISGHFCDSSISNNPVIETLSSLRAYKETAATLKAPRMKRLCWDMVLKQSGCHQAGSFLLFHALLSQLEGHQWQLCSCDLRKLLLLDLTTFSTYTCSPEEIGDVKVDLGPQSLWLMRTPLKQRAPNPAEFNDTLPKQKRTFVILFPAQHSSWCFASSVPSDHCTAIVRGTKQGEVVDGG